MARRETHSTRWRRILLQASIALIAGLSFHTYGAFGQESPKAPVPRKFEPALFILGDQVVEQQWKSAPDFINMPTYWRQIEPGQCVRFGVELSKNDIEKFRGATLEVVFSTAGHDQKFPAEPMDTVKQLKADNGDIMNAVLAKAGINAPHPALLSIAVSHINWCAPADAADATATVQASLVGADGQMTTLKPASLAVRTFETARKAPAFTDIRTLGRWEQQYYTAPNPAMLLTALRLQALDRTGHMLNSVQFMISAFKASPQAAEEARRILPQENHAVQLYAIPILQLAGYPLGALPDDLTPAEKSWIGTVHLPDPYDMKPDREIGSRMDLLWSIFFATGQFEPVDKIASLLSRRADYDKFVEFQKSGVKPPPPELTGTIMSGISYMTAGWSLNALSRSNGLVADYLDAIKSSPSTSSDVKAELVNLPFNKAFQRPNAAANPASHQ